MVEGWGLVLATGGFGELGSAVGPSLRGLFLRIASKVMILPAQGIDFLDFTYAAQPSHHP